MKKSEEKTYNLSDIPLLANDLGKSVRTIERWLNNNPKIQKILGAKKLNGRWRFRLPQDSLELEVTLLNIRKEIEPTRRSSGQDKDFGEQVSADWGLNNKRIIREIKMLKIAMSLKRASRKIYSDDQNSQELDQNLLSIEQWKAEAEEICSNARRIAKRYNCRIKKVPSHWKHFIQEEKKKNQEYNAPFMGWLKKLGLGERTKQLILNQTVTSLILLRGKITKVGKRKSKLYRLPNGYNERKENKYFDRYVFQLLPEFSRSDIDEDFALMLEIWPDKNHWRVAKQSQELRWQEETLVETISDLIKEQQDITGNNIAKLLFLSQNRQDVWKLHQKHLELKKQGKEPLCFEQICEYGKRGFSLRTFRKRYNKRQIKEGIKKALKGDASDIFKKAQGNKPEEYVDLKDLENMMVYDQHFLPDLGEKTTENIDSDYRDKFRNELLITWPEIKVWLLKLTPAKRKALEEHFWPNFFPGKNCDKKKDFVKEVEKEFADQLSLLPKPKE